MSDIIHGRHPATELERRIQAAISTLEPIESPDDGPALVADQVRQTLVETLALDFLSEAQWAELLATGALGRTLLKLGYSLKARQVPGRWCSPRQAQDWLSVFVREPELTPHQSHYTLSLAAGLAVYAPVVIVDEDRLVMLQMLGAPEAVNANWAALVGGGKSHWIKGERVQLGGMKEYIRLKAALPCGWSETWLIHRQASLTEMTPGQPGYVIDNGLSPLISKFFWLCDKSLPIPLHANWAEHLWLAGRQRRLVTLVDPEQCHGLAAWRVDPDLNTWEAIVSTGLQQGILTF